MSKIIKSNLARAMDFKKIEAIKLPDLKFQEEIDDTSIISDEEIIQNSLIEKEKILSKAKEEAEKIKQEAAKQGYQAGYEEGIAMGKKKLDEMETKINFQYGQLVENFHHTQEILVSQASKEVLEIALFIAKKLVGDLVQEKDELVVELYKLLMPSVTDKNIQEITCNPLDSKHLESYLEFINKSDKIKLSISPEIDKGSIKIITDQGYLLQNVDKQMEEIISELRKFHG